LFQVTIKRNLSINSVFSSIDVTKYNASRHKSVKDQ